MKIKDEDTTIGIHDTKMGQDDLRRMAEEFHGIKGEKEFKAYMERNKEDFDKINKFFRFTKEQIKELEEKRRKGQI